MAARASEFPTTQSDAVHEYYAKANVLHADITEPIQEVVNPQALVTLPKGGGYQFRKADPFRLEGIISYESGYTQVAGHRSTKNDGFTTLSTSVLEGLNILDVVTADRVVAQLSTVHPAYGSGQVPSVTFLGTRFDNLRIAGHRVEVDHDLDFLGKPENDESYFENHGVLDRVSKQYERIATAMHLPDWARKEYPSGRPVVNGNGSKTLECSLVKAVEGGPGTQFGHIIDLPHFGRIFLGELKVERESGNPAKGICDSYKFKLTMIRIKMGCISTGNTSSNTATSNGQGSGGGTGTGH
jgi:hypothetical protein